MKAVRSQFDLRMLLGVVAGCALYLGMFVSFTGLVLFDLAFVFLTANSWRRRAQPSHSLFRTFSVTAEWVVIAVTCFILNGIAISKLAISSQHYRLGW